MGITLWSFHSAADGTVARAVMLGENPPGPLAGSLAKSGWQNAAVAHAQLARATACLAPRAETWESDLPLLHDVDQRAH